ncbi:hypothetical protein ACWET9_38500 [Streptomyces sp. NPDC004059]
MDRIESEVLAREGLELPPPSGYLTGRQRASIPFPEIARLAAQRYPRRALLGLAPFVGQAFQYNAVRFDLGTTQRLLQGGLWRGTALHAALRDQHSSVRCCSGNCSTRSGASR